MRLGEGEFYVAVSIKCLICPELDEELLHQKFIKPYEFNKLYHVCDKKITEICKMSLIQSIKTDADGMSIILPDRKILKVPLKNETEAHNFSIKICRCCEIAK